MFVWNRWNKIVMEEAGDGGGSGGGSPDPDKGGKKGLDDKTPPEDTPPKDPGGSGKTGEKDKGTPGESLEDLPTWAQKQIKDLRSESAKNRTDNKTIRGEFDSLKKGMAKALGIEDDAKPEDKIADLNGQNSSLTFQNAILSVAVQNGIGEKQMDYFSFLMEKAVEKLDEGQELSDDQLAELVKKAKAQGGVSSDSSVDDTGGDGKPPKNPDSSGDMTLEQFCALNIIEKSSLYRTKPDVYNRLVSQAKAKGVLI